MKYNKISIAKRILFTKRLLKIAGKKEDLKNKYPNFSNEIEYFANNDPSGTNKYLQWALKMFSAHNGTAAEILEVINMFNKNIHKLQNKDINNYNLKDLKLLLLELDKTNTTRQEKIKIKTTGGNKVYEDDQCSAYIINGREAACFYGKGTKWCTTVETDSYLEKYMSDNAVVVYVLRKDKSIEDPEYKVAILFDRTKENKIYKITFFNALDQKTSSSEYLSDLNNIGIILSTVKQAAENEKQSAFAKLRYGIPTELTEKDLSNKNTLLFAIDKDFYIEPNLFLKLFNKNIDFLLQNIEIVFNYKYLPSEVLVNLSNTNDEKILCMVAKHHNTPEDILWKIAKLSNKYAGFLLDNKNLNKDIIKFIIKELPFSDENSSEYQKIARHKNTPKDILDKLSNNNNEKINLIIASNENTDIQTLDKLSKSNFRSVKLEVARNKNTPINILLSFINKKDSVMLMTLMRNPSFPKEMLSSLF